MKYAIFIAAGLALCVGCSKQTDKSSAVEENLFTATTRIRNNMEPVFVRGAKPGEQPMSASSWTCEKCNQQHITTVSWSTRLRVKFYVQCLNCGDAHLTNL